MALKELATQTVGDLELAQVDECALTPDELMEKMAVTSQEYWHAMGELRKISRTKLIKEAAVTAVVQARRPDLLVNQQARELFELCCADPKFKPTVDFTESIVYMEGQSLVEPYNYWEGQLKQLSTYYNMLSGQLIWYQSQNRVNAAEMMTLASQPG